MFFFFLKTGKRENEGFVNEIDEAVVGGAAEQVVCSYPEMRVCVSEKLRCVFIYDGLPKRKQIE